MLKEVIQTLKDIEIPTGEEIIDDIKKEIEEEIIDPILDPIRENDQIQALAACNANAKKNLGWGYYTPAAGLWIVSCMAQKGFSVSLKYVKEKLGI
jgi:hypothetical protein